MNTNYINYNPVKVTINGTYTITNVNKRGFPGNECCAHLESLEIKLPLGADNAESVGASGTINVIDYKDAVFNALRGALYDYINGGKTDSNLLPTVKIEISCFTDTKEWTGHIEKWGLTFAGSTPTLTLEWTAFGTSPADTPALQNGHYNSPKDLYDKAKETYKDQQIPFVDNNGKDIIGNLRFRNERGVDYDVTRFPSCKNKLIDVYNFIISNSELTSDTEHKKALTAEYKNDKYYVYVKDMSDPNSRSSEDAVASQLVFVQNGAYKYYEPRPSDGRYVIPMNSFNYNVDSSNLILQNRVFSNMNGTTVYNQANGQSQYNSGTIDQNIAGQESDANGASGIKCTFECYNTMALSKFDTKQKVLYEIYNEFGKKSIFSGEGTVTDCTISVSGAVVKTSVSCTEEFNEAKTETVDGGSSIGGLSSGDDTSSGVNYSSYSSGSSGGGSSSQASNMSSGSSNLVEYLMSEDKITNSLYADISDEKRLFRQYVKDFLNSYGDLTGSNKLLSYEFTRNMIVNGQIGLLTLLLAVGNYGISGVPDKCFDVVAELAPDYKGKKKKFFASDSGKAPYDYTKGGLGIAHWDSGNLKNIYEDIGFSQDDYNQHRTEFESLLVTSGKILRWEKFDYKEGSITVQNRYKPVFSQGVKMRLFDKGLKQNQAWKDWAYKILHFRSANGEPVFQYYLFDLWLKKFWFPTINKLKSAKPDPGHKIGLQDAVRISRAGNSATGLISSMSGKNVAKQYKLYYGDKPRYIRQKAFCRRCADYIAFVLGSNI